MEQTVGKVVQCDGMMKPIFRNYVGGKRGHIKHFKHLLAPCTTYVEPFCGAAAVYCYMQSNGLANKFILNDNNPDLILIYSEMKNNFNKFVKDVQYYANMWNCLPFESYDAEKNNALRRSKHRRRTPESPEFDRKDCYYYLRDWEYVRRPLPAILYVLMQISFKGVIDNQNKEQFGYFATGCGMCSRTLVVDMDNLHLWHKALQSTTLLNLDYKSVPIPDNGDTLIYCDPIYRNASHYNQDTPTDACLYQMLEHFQQYPCIYSNTSDGLFFENNPYGYKYLTFSTNHHMAHVKATEIVLYKNLSMLKGLPR